MEDLWGILKREKYYRRKFASHEQLVGMTEGGKSMEKNSDNMQTRSDYSIRCDITEILCSL